MQNSCPAQAGRVRSLNKSGLELQLQRSPSNTLRSGTNSRQHRQLVPKDDTIRCHAFGRRVRHFEADTAASHTRLHYQDDLPSL